MARQIDQDAEALRSRAQQQKLGEALEGLHAVKEAAHRLKDPAFEKKVAGWTGQVESQVEREKRELAENEEQVALKQALALEEYALHIQQQVAELERITNNTELTPVEKVTVLFVYFLFFSRSDASFVKTGGARQGAEDARVGAGQDRGPGARD